MRLAGGPLIFPRVGIKAPILYKGSRKSKVYLNIQTTEVSEYVLEMRKMF